MKHIFFGTSEFAAIILEKLIKAGFVPEAVVCNPDKPVGRKKVITAPPVKKLLIEKFKDLKIKILQPAKLEIGNSLPSGDLPKGENLEFKKIKNIVFDFFVVAAYAKILPKEILEIPRLGAIGVHPSLLPKYRGSSPIQTAILNGNEETGTTLYLMDEKMDHGKIISNLKFQISKIDNYKTLMRKLAELSADLLVENLPNIEEKIKNAKPQNELQATYTKKFKTEDAFIAPEDLKIAVNHGGEIALETERKIRALNPEPGTWTVKENKRMKILEAVLTSEGKLKLKKIQFEGKKPIDISNRENII
jgi:methionyl-tRNA formyltransferase